MTFPLVGLTGLPCAGKSMAERLLARRGWVAIDADALTGAAFADDGLRAALVRRFGPEVVDERGEVVRKRLAALVFADAVAGEPPPGSALADLEALLHPWIMARARGQAGTARRSAPVALSAALLFAAGGDAECDAVWVVESPEADRLARALERGWSPEELSRRSLRQRPALERALAAGRAVRIVNNGTPEGLDAALSRAAALLPGIGDCAGGS